MPLTIYFASFASTSTERGLVVFVDDDAFVIAIGSTALLEILSPRIGSGVDSRAPRVVRRRSEDEFSIFFLYFSSLSRLLTLKSGFFLTAFFSLFLHSHK